MSPPIEFATKNGKVWSQFGEVTPYPTNDQKWRTSIEVAQVILALSS